MIGNSTKTAFQLSREAKLEAIDDAICDLYSGQGTKIIFKYMNEEGRDALKKYLMEQVMQPLREWREVFEG